MEKKPDVIPARYAMLFAAAANLISLIVTLTTSLPLLSSAALLIALGASAWGWWALRGARPPQAPDRRPGGDPHPPDEPRVRAPGAPERDPPRIQQRLFGDPSGALGAAWRATDAYAAGEKLLPKSGGPTPDPPGAVMPTLARNAPGAGSGAAPTAAPAFDGRQLVKACILAFEEMEAIRERSSGPQHDVAAQASHDLRTALASCGVEIIDNEGSFSGLRHQALGWPPGAAPPPGAPIAEVVSPGFALDKEVLRRAVVRLV